jgi:putative transposase
MAVKSVWQYFQPSREIIVLLDIFKKMVNDSVRIGLANDASSLRRLSLLSYNQLAGYDSPSCYKLCAISRAAGILASRKKSLKRGFSTRQPHSVKPFLVSCYSFKVKNKVLEIPYHVGNVSAFP